MYERIAVVPPIPLALKLYRHGRKENRLADQLVCVQGAMSPSIQHTNCFCKDDLIEVDASIDARVDV
jgi:hypothetical protein